MQWSSKIITRTLFVDWTWCWLCLFGCRLFAVLWLFYRFVFAFVVKVLCKVNLTFLVEYCSHILLVYILLHILLVLCIWKLGKFAHTCQMVTIIVHTSMVYCTWSQTKKSSTWGCCKHIYCLVMRVIKCTMTLNVFRDLPMLSRLSCCRF